MSVDEIEQLYVKQELNINQTPNAGQGLMNHTSVPARSRPAKSNPPRNNDADIARALEYLIEQHLGIEDRKV